MNEEQRKAEIERLRQIVFRSLDPVEGLPESEREKILTTCKNSIVKLLAKGETLEQFLNE